MEFLTALSVIWLLTVVGSVLFTRRMSSRWLSQVGNHVRRCPSLVDPPTIRETTWAKMQRVRTAVASLSGFTVGMTVAVRATSPSRVAIAEVTAIRGMRLHLKASKYFPALTELNVTAPGCSVSCWVSRCAYSSEGWLLEASADFEERERYRQFNEDRAA